MLPLLTPASRLEDLKIADVQARSKWRARVQVSHQKMKALPPPVINIATYQTITRCKQWRFREVLITVEECDAKTLPRANIVLNKFTSYRVPQKEFSDRKNP